MMIPREACNFSCVIGIFAVWGLSSLFQHVDLVTTSLRAGFQVYLS